MINQAGGPKTKKKLLFDKQEKVNIEFTDVLVRMRKPNGYRKYRFTRRGDSRGAGR